MASNGHLTPTHQRIMAVLADGQPHTSQELQGCLWDDMSEPRVISRHLSTLRKILRERSEGLVTHRDRYSTSYQLVRLLSSPYE